jgi:hypothetical protein
LVSLAGISTRSTFDNALQGSIFHLTALLKAVFSIW